MNKFLLKLKEFKKEFTSFLRAWYLFLSAGFLKFFWHFEKRKRGVAEKLYEGRGKFIRPFVHSGMGGLALLGILLAPIVGNSLSGQAQVEGSLSGAVLSLSDEMESQTSTFISDKPRAEIIEYKVEKGDTLSEIGKKFGVSVDSICWANGIDEGTALKPNQVLKIPPVTGVIHRVKKGETVYSIAKYYKTDPQGIVDYPYNTFMNDETFELAVGQILIVPDGVMPKSEKVYLAQKTPDAGTVVASGVFVWPTSGKISQGFRWYHKAIDIANETGTPILAADSGKVIVAGWPDNVGYGNRVVIDHGNGFVTLYAHMSRIAVTEGQTVARGSVIGYMGSTGRSTGPHLHFEIRLKGVNQDPMAYLK